MSDIKRTVRSVSHNNATKKIVGYIRISSRTQESGYGKDLQMKALNDYCLTNTNVELIQTFTDSAVSGTEKGLEGRKAFFELLKFCETNEVTHILVYDISRIWRDEIVAATLKRQIRKHSLEVISIQQPEYSIGTDSPSSQLVSGIMEQISVFERGSLVLRMNSGRMSKFLAGNFGGGGLPLGFTTVNRELVVLESEMSIVRFIYRKKRGGWSVYKIAKVLRDNSVRGKNGGVIQCATVKKVLRCKAYRGYLKYSGKLYPSSLGKVI